MVEHTAVKPVESTDAGGIKKFCKRCQYPLRGLEIVGGCPECGRTYDLGNHNTYTYDDNRPSLPKRLLRNNLWLLVLLADLAFGYFLLPQLDYASIVVFPLWVMVTTYLALDITYRVLHIGVGFIAMLFGGAIGVALTTLVLHGNVFFPLALIGVLCGLTGGVCLVQAEISNLRRQ